MRAFLVAACAALLAHVCAGGSSGADIICSFSTESAGDHTVPAPGCQLSQMVTVDGSDAVMNISSASFAADEPHLVTVDRALGCTPSSDDGGACRLFKVVNGGKLYLSHIHLRGGKVDLGRRLLPVGPTDVAAVLCMFTTADRSCMPRWSVFGTGNIGNPPTEKAASAGGALFARKGAAILLEDSRVVGNWADFEGGGVALYSGSSLTAMRSEISGNRVWTTYSGVSVGGAVTVVDGSVFKAVQTNISL